MTYDFYGVEYVPQALEYKCQKSQHLIWPLAPCIFTGTRNILTEKSSALFNEHPDSFFEQHETWERGRKTLECRRKSFH